MSGKVTSKSAVFIIFTYLIIGACLFLFKESKPTEKTSPKNFNFNRVQYRFQIYNTENQPISNANFYVHAPLELTSSQRCIQSGN